MTRGTSVQVVFQQAGLSITAYASPLQDGSAGDVIRVRNTDSGVIIRGVVQPDGTVRVGARMTLLPARSRRSCASPLRRSEPADAAVRIKDIADLQGVRDNQIVGYGLVIGLKGTGDSLRNSPFTEQSLQSMLDSMGINVRDSSLRTRNVAGVIVTAELPPFIGKGARIDVTVSSLGDATSLLGGTLVHDAVDGRRRRDLCGGAGRRSRSPAFPAKATRESLTEGVPTTGRIPNGALIEREVQGDFDELEGARARAEESGLQHGGARRRRDQRLCRAAATGRRSPSSATFARSCWPSPRTWRAALHRRDRRARWWSPTRRRASSSTSGPGRW